MSISIFATAKTIIESAATQPVMTLAEMANQYNEFAEFLGLDSVKRFADKKKAVKRLIEISEKVVAEEPVAEVEAPAEKPKKVRKARAKKSTGMVCLPGHYAPVMAPSKKATKVKKERTERVGGTKIIIDGAEGVAWGAITQRRTTLKAAKSIIVVGELSARRLDKVGEEVKAKITFMTAEEFAATSSK